MTRPRLSLSVLRAAPSLAKRHEAEATSRMKLSCELDDVENVLEQPAQSRARRPIQLQAPRAALPLEPNSTAEAVTVFRDRALVTRSRTLKVDAGETSVTFEGLPLAMLDGSIVATADGGTLVGVEVESGTGEVDEARQVALKEELRGHVEALGEVRDRMEALLARRATLRNAVLSRGQDGAPPVREIQALLDFVSAAERDIAKDLRAEEEAAKDLNEVVLPLLTKLRNPMATGKTVRVDVGTQASGSVTVKLRYAVTGAGWSPAYDLRFEPSEDKLGLSYLGVVRQSTGEDWTNVKMSLSTATPEVGGTLPRLPAWRLGEGFGSGSLVAGQGLVGTSGGAPTQTSDLLTEEMSADVEGTGALVFQLSGLKSVVGDGSAQRLPLGLQTYSVDTHLTAAPRVVARVFREGEVRIGGSVPLLAGPASTYVGGDFVGTGPLASTLPGETLKLALGTDDRVRVSRRITERRRDLSGRKHKYTFRFALDVANPSDKARTITVRELVPISEDADVDVRLLDGTAPDQTLADGELRWTLEVAPGAVHTVEVGFTVIAPADRSFPALDAML
ncbi:MAG: mucoidy inhibitor MuiA family protein [Myxococcota bacterium]